MCYTNFEEVIIELVKDKYEAKRQDNVLLENIKIKTEYFSPRTFARTESYIVKLQDDEFKGIVGHEYQQKAKELLDALCDKGAVELYLDGIYKLKKDGDLYKRIIDDLK